MIKTKLKRKVINFLPYKGSDSDHISFFIFGTGRNGSTLLASLLNNHQNIFIPPEQYAFPFLAFKFYLYNKLGLSLSNKSALNYFKSHSFKWKIFNTPNDLENQPKTRTIQDFFKMCYDLEAHLNGKDAAIMYGDKTPYNTPYFPIINKLYPNAKYIFLIRNPKDVIVSQLKMNSPYTLKHLIYFWKESVLVMEKAVINNLEHITIKYEDLVSKNYNTIERLCHFLNLDFDPEILKNYNKNMDMLGVKNISFHQNINAPIHGNSIGNWKTQLTQNQINEIDSRLSKEMKLFNYQ